MKLTNKYLVISLIELKRYNDVVEIVKVVEELSSSEVACYLIALFIVDKNEYERLFNEEFEFDKMSVLEKKFYSKINSYLNKCDKIILNKLENFSIIHF